MEEITLSQAKTLIQTLSHKESLLILSAPGMGKSDIVRQAAEEKGLPVRSLLGTQIAPEDVSGVPRIVGERSVFCPPRVLLPEDNKPFCLFLDEFPAAAPDVQKALYALLLERRLGEFELPKGTWVVAAGNRQQDRALVRQMSSALINRTFVFEVKLDHKEWLVWAQKNGIRKEIIAFITFLPEVLMRPVPQQPVPFSTPRAWASLSNAITLSEQAGILNREMFKALCFARVTDADAAIFSALADSGDIQGSVHELKEYVSKPELLSKFKDKPSWVWFVLNLIRKKILSRELTFSSEILNAFLIAIPREWAFSLLANHVAEWEDLGTAPALFNIMKEVTGLSIEQQSTKDITFSQQE